MAEQARRINESDPRRDWLSPPVADELGRLAVSFNGLLDRLASALNSNVSSWLTLHTNCGRRCRSSGPQPQVTLARQNPPQTNTESR